MYSTKHSSHPGDTVGPPNVTSPAILGGTPFAASTSKFKSECFGTANNRMLDNSVKDGESYEISEPMVTICIPICARLKLYFSIIYPFLLLIE